MSFQWHLLTFVFFSHFCIQAWDGDSSWAISWWGRGPESIFLGKQRDVITDFRLWNRPLDLVRRRCQRASWLARESWARPLWQRGRLARVKSFPPMTLLSRYRLLTYPTPRIALSVRSLVGWWQNFSRIIHTCSIVKYQGSWMYASYINTSCTYA